MRRGAWEGLGTVGLIAVLSGPGPARAQDFYFAQDVTAVEGSGSVALTILRTNPAFTTDVFYRTVSGSAAAGSDFSPVSTFVTFSSSDTIKTIFVPIVNDSTPEPSATTTLPDEYFFVELYAVSGAGMILDGRATVRILDDDRSLAGAQLLSVVTDGTDTSGRNRLQWRVPAGQPNPPTEFHIRWDKGPSCSFPADTAGGIGGTGNFTANAPGAAQGYTHTVVTPHDTWCYSIFTFYPAQSPERVTVKTKTFDSAGALKWTLTNTAALPSLAPPTVGQDAVYSLDNDGVLHAMQRSGVQAGWWPGTWNPLMLGGVTSSRSPAVPLPSGWRLLVGTENGEIHAVDGQTGFLQWSRSAAFGNSQLMTSSVGPQAAPALLLRSFGGLNDLLLVGTATGASNTKFFALDPQTGATRDEYPNGGDAPPGIIENVYGMAVVDYAANRVYFGTTGSGASFTLWSLTLGPMGTPDLTLTPSGTLTWNPAVLGSMTGTSGSPVLRNGHIYLGTGSGASGAMHSLRISDGVVRSHLHGDGQAKSFPWPDRRNGRIYFSTTGFVHALNDDGSSFGPDPGWVAGPLPMTNPSPVLHRPGTDELYVGDGAGRLVRINASTGEQVGAIALDAGSVIGAPSLDNVNNLLLVGSDKGVIYAVSVGF
jgi:hypothetical protein